MDFTPDIGSRRSKRPRFGFEGTVEVWTETGLNCTPAAILVVSGWAWHRDQAHTDALHDAKCQLARLKVPLDVIQAAYFETAVAAWWALDPKHVRNPENNPVPAHYLTLDATEHAALLRQQRLVPESLRESSALYLTKTPEAVPA
ncbi:hypothetical protein [Acidovorax sp.]|uniref:hypothetical protein n=1 Tax=Acidovorax sp. TaxID=1872122 RepID=UPI0025885601|nr:hypothetical protein [Acidovorax sp.]